MTELSAFASHLACMWDDVVAGPGAPVWQVREGALLKVDLSGFTRLSERLALSVTTGAEDLNAALDDVLSHLVEQALRRGGDVLQFAGDALLVWFEGRQAQQRCAASALAMHAYLRARPAERSPGGRPVKLRMSAGAAGGKALFAVLGADHRELVVLGPLASAVTRLEAAASTGQTLLAEVTAGVVTAGVVPAGVAQETAGSTVDGIAVRRAPAHDPVPRTPRGAAAVASRFLAPDVLAFEQGERLVGEHRRAAVAFIRLSGTDALVLDQGPGAAVAAVQDVTRAVERAVALSGVCWTATDLATDGVVWLLYAGAPLARDVDAERMLGACRAVLDATSGLPVHIGANYGRVFAGNIGHPDRRAFAALGDATNVAARLMGQAPPGTALVSRDLWERSRRQHEVVWRPALAAKGRRRPVEHGVLGSRVEIAMASRGPSPPVVTLVGRQDDLDLLNAWVDAQAAGQGDAAPPLALVGEAGAGKSRLVAAAMDRAARAGLAVVRAVGSPLDVTSPYAALRPALRRVLGMDGSLDALAVVDQGADAGLSALLNLPLGLDLPLTDQARALDPRFVAARRHDLLARLLDAATQGRLLVAVEDPHWLDQASLGLLDALAEQARRPGLLLASRTPVAGLLTGAQRWREHRLAALDDAAARHLALLAAGEVALSDLELDRVVRDAGGNPLFLTELARFAGRSGLDEVPDSAEAVIAAGIDQLPGPDRALLREASAAGSSAPLPLLAEVLEDPTCARPARWRAMSAYVVVVPGDRAPDGQWAGMPLLQFRHDLYRRVAYAALPVRRRRALHGRLADALGSAGSAVDPAVVARHLHEAGRWGEAFGAARAAAHAARAAGALGDAAALYRRALDAGRRASEPDEALAQVAAASGDVEDLLGRYEASRAAYRFAASCCAAGRRAHLLVLQAAVVERLGAYRHALALLTRAQRTAVERGQGDVGRAALLRRSSVLYRQGRLRDSYAVAEQVAAQAQEAGDPRDLALSLLRLEMVASELGLPQRFELGTRALAAFVALEAVGVRAHRDYASLLGNLGVTAWESDDWRLALERHEASAAEYALAGDAVGQAFAANNAGEILCDQGRYEQAEAAFQQARRVFRAAGHALGVASTSSSLGRIAARHGRWEEATAYLEQAHEQLSALGSRVLAVDALVRQVEVAVLRGDGVAAAGAAVVQAREVLARVDALDADAVLPATIRRYLALAELQAGRVQDGEALLRDALGRATAQRALYERYLCLDALARLGVLVAGSAGAMLEDAELTDRLDIARRLGVLSTPVYPPFAREGAS